MPHQVQDGKLDTGLVENGKIMPYTARKVGDQYCVYKKDAWKLFKAIDEKAGKVLVCLSNPTELTLRAVRNIRGVVLVKPEQVTALDIIECRKLVATGEAMEILSRRLTK